MLALAAALGVGGYVGGRQLWARHHFRAAERALAARDLAQARVHLDLCLEVWSNSAATHLLAARTARRAGSLDRAEEYLDICDCLGGQSDALALERALLYAQRGGLADVEETLRSYLDAGHPDAPLVLEVLTTALMKADRLPEALSLLDLWLTLSPDDPEALVRRGWTHEFLLDYTAAARDYEHALTLAPDQDRVRLALAELLVGTGRPAEAVGHFERLSERTPRDPAVRYGLARCRLRMGRAEEGRRLLDGLLAERPGDHQALVERGRLALAAGQAVEAERDLRAAVAQDPQDLRLLYSYHQCLKQLGRDREASAYADRLKSIEADLDRASRLGDQLRAKAARDPAGRCELGQLLLRLGFDRDGLRWLAAALRDDPDHRPAHEALAAYYRRAGKPDLEARHRQALGTRAAGTHDEKSKKVN